MTVSFLTQLPEENLNILFEKLSINDQVNLSQTSTRFYTLFATHRLWESVLNVINPEIYKKLKSSSVISESPIKFYDAVKDFYLKTKDIVALIEARVTTEIELELLFSLEHFRLKPLFERSYIVWKSLQEDATSIFAKLVHCSYSRDQVVDESWIAFNNHCFQTVKKIIENYKISYSVSNVVFHTVCQRLHPENVMAAGELAAMLVRLCTRKELSVLKHKDVPYFSISVPAQFHVKNFLMSKLVQLDLTHEDLENAGLTSTVF